MIRRIISIALSLFAGWVCVTIILSFQDEPLCSVKLRIAKELLFLALIFRAHCRPFPQDQVKIPTLTMWLSALLVGLGFFFAFLARNADSGRIGMAMIGIGIAVWIVRLNLRPLSPVFGRLVAEALCTLVLGIVLGYFGAWHKGLFLVCLAMILLVVDFNLGEDSPKDPSPSPAQLPVERDDPMVIDMKQPQPPRDAMRDSMDNI